MFDVKLEAAAAIKILQSRMVIGEAVDEINLDTRAKPTRLPFLRIWLAWYGKVFSDPTILNSSGHAWGDEWLDPVEGVEGHVGATVVLKQLDSPIKLRVNSTDTKPGTQFVLTKLSLGKIVEYPQMRRNFPKSGRRDIGDISASLLGLNRQLTCLARVGIGNTCADENPEGQPTEVVMLLASLNDLLPQLKDDIEHTQGRCYDMRNHIAVFNVREKCKPYLWQAAGAQRSLLELKDKRAALYSTYAPGRPGNQLLGRQDGMLSAIGSMEQRQALPGLEQNAVSSTGDACIDNELYVTRFEATQVAEVVETAMHFEQENACVKGVICNGLEADVDRR
ncbi:hypothetical protein ACMX25_32270 [Caballeronia sp. 15715]|uniref:hypothetical protein n=1 Tax=Caballeronia sp. 15715 TaxID=3391030 RepID=UPI0039E622E6